MEQHLYHKLSIKKCSQRVLIHILVSFNNKYTGNPLLILWRHLLIRYLARVVNIFSFLGLIDPQYYPYGLIASPFNITRFTAYVQHLILIHKCNSLVFVFYWHSILVDFNSIICLQNIFPQARFIFIQVDDSIFTSVCHYRNNCDRYLFSCSSCPITKYSFLQKRIETNYHLKLDVLTHPNTFCLLVSRSALYNLSSSPDYKNICLDYKYLPSFTDQEFNSYLNQRTAFIASETPLTLLIRMSTDPRKVPTWRSIYFELISHVDSSIDSPEIHVKLIGDLSIFPDYQSDKLFIENLGFVNRDVLLNIYASSHILVITSLVDSSLMFNEACMLGLSVISTPVGIVSDFLNLNLSHIYISDSFDPANFSDFTLRTIYSTLSSNHMSLAARSFFPTSGQYVDRLVSLIS